MIESRYSLPCVMSRMTTDISSLSVKVQCGVMKKWNSQNCLGFSWVTVGSVVMVYFVVSFVENCTLILCLEWLARHNSSRVACSKGNMSVLDSMLKAKVVLVTRIHGVEVEMGLNSLSVLSTFWIRFRCIIRF